MGKSGELGPEGEPGIKVPLYIRSLLFKYIKMCLFNNSKSLIHYLVRSAHVFLSPMVRIISVTTENHIHVHGQKKKKKKTI